MGLQKLEEKEYAKMLFLDTTQKLTVQEIAKRAGNVRPSTVSKWISDGNWEKLRKSLLVTRKVMISDLYDQLDALNTHIKTRPIIYDIPKHLLKGTVIKDKTGKEKTEIESYNPKDYSILVGNFATPSEAQTIAVVTTSIKRLESETSISEIYEVATTFLDFIKPQDFKLFKQLVPLFDSFISDKLK